jgi:galactokinase
MNSSAELIHEFKNSFDANNPMVVFAPGKINLLGQHLADVNETVIEATIDAGIYIGLNTSTNNQTHIINNDLFEQIIFEDKIVENDYESHWKNIMLELFSVLNADGFALKPLNILFGGNLPQGKALYYDAALILGIIYGCNQLFNWKSSNCKLCIAAAKIGNKIIPNYYSVSDFLTLLEGKEHCFVVLNSNTNIAEIVEMDTSNFQLVVTNTAYENNLPKNIWNERKEELTNALSFYKTINKRINTFSQVNSSVAEQFMYNMDEPVAKRSLYVAEEIERVQKGVELCKQNNWEAFGSLLFKSHKGLIDLYETTNANLNFLVNESKLHNNCLGSKQLGKESYMISMVKPYSTDVITTNVLTSYKSVYKLNASANVYTIGKGLQQVVSTY